MKDRGYLPVKKKHASSSGLSLEILKVWGRLIIADYIGEYTWRGKEKNATG